MLASVGIGAARVDTRLDRTEVRLGENLRGHVLIEGGNVAQTIEYVALHVMTRVKHDEHHDNESALEFRLGGPVDVRPGERVELPFDVTVPYHAPLSLPGTDVWLHTGASVSGVDPTDQDRLVILPNAPVEALLRGAERLGLRLRRSEVERAHGWGRGLVQELEFHPPYGFGVTEVEMVLFPGRDHVEVILEVDRRARGVASLFVGEFESRSRWHVTPDLIARGPDAVAQELARRIRRT
ncbi:sporulation protein [Deinococcus pimensis]|uniref:sporulation protein n=1 Tax=Deinococcus pimensis TaxID=309888 RepID=UPI001FDEB352|nr:sporulation protein [Deinococcus pimensis]